MPRVCKELRRIAGYHVQNERPDRTARISLPYRRRSWATYCWTGRGGESPASVAERVDLDAVPEIGTSRAQELIALDDALNELAKIDPRKASAVELRFFGGLTAEETAEVLKVSSDTVLRDGKLARAWLLSELKGKE